LTGDSFFVFLRQSLVTSACGLSSFIFFSQD
jgi:hypothetical protein